MSPFQRAGKSSVGAFLIPAAVGEVLSRYITPFLLHLIGDGTPLRNLRVKQSGGLGVHHCYTSDWFPDSRPSCGDRVSLSWVCYANLVERERGSPQGVGGRTKYHYN